MAETYSSHKKGPPIPDKQPQALKELVAPHVDSFNSFLEEDLPMAIDDLAPHRVTNVPGVGAVQFWIEDVNISYPTKNDDSLDSKLYPYECRELRLTYKAPMYATVCRRVGDLPVEKFQRKFGAVPIMVRSNRCHLANMSPAQLIKHNEEATEMGGYFIVGGNERLIRMLILPRRNHVMAITRGAFSNRGPTYTNMATSIRCVRPDQTGQTVVLHYLKDGTCTLRFLLKKQEFFIPTITLLKAFVDTTDREIYEKITAGDVTNTFLTDRVELMLRDAKKYNVHTKNQCLAFLGARFRVALGYDDDMTDSQVAVEMIRRHIFVHLDRARDKFNLLVYMIRKLYAFVGGEISEDNADSPMNQEILVGGHLYTMMIKEKFADWLETLQTVLQKDLKNNVGDIQDATYFKKAMDKCGAAIGRKLEYFLATGNLVSTSGLDMMQVSGYTIIAEKLNYLRYIAHFRCVHRGAFFATMKTTSVRKLLPEAWGFMCPVHTPDGAPCGLLNHLTAACQVVCEQQDVSGLEQVLVGLGMVPIETTIAYDKQHMTVFLDGRVIGHLNFEDADGFAENLRFLKVTGHDGVPSMLEIGYVPRSADYGGGKAGPAYPGMFLFSTPARMMRQVRYLATDQMENIGSFEQVFLNVACLDEDIKPGRTTHQDPHPTSMLSIVANLTPFSDFNQSPRNMYQCQMGKQTMGTPCHTFGHRCDNKMYRLQTPQAPIVRTQGHVKYNIDDYAQGTNAIVAVISYTGYDMEDAMILKKAAYERGMAHGTVYTSKVYDLDNYRDKNEPLRHRFTNYKTTADEVRDNRIKPELDSDGLPHIGQKVKQGDPLAVIVDDTTNKVRFESHKSQEPAIVEEVRLLGMNPQAALGAAPTPLQRVGIKLRLNRNPIIGDKFSSRHGQKGVLSQLWPEADMPFTESGMTPDIIINPHAFPSRMTIGMLVESMAAKSGAIHGMYQDATPFQFTEQDRAVDYFGQQLQKCGYNYYGNEPMYSGIHGTEFKADIFIGVVYYQRLRHMVSDKYQVRSTGKVNQLTRQPVKGRKMGGGIRFGEMERDSLLSHGVAYALHDRLMMCSDASQGHICRLCGNLLSAHVVPETIQGGETNEVTCRVCKTGDGVELVNIPFVFRYLANELAAMNIRLTLDVKAH
eukprot:TRINITY_DN13816_c0_g1_i1.p1 TRINITY_DN13816_c0_g1~~TRINITY_DN13816_c0_g1_i1.p1  ORF type:complete len:1143 (-),score=294.48 TRINITY_DN13816_c0_g1_i1:13-3441(-)